MIEVRDDNLALLLTALADGELDAEDALGVWNHLADHPDALRWLREQQRITLTARQAMAFEGVNGGSAPDELRARIENIVHGTATSLQPPRLLLDSGKTVTSREAPRSLAWLRFVGAMAAGLLIGLSVAFYWPRHSAPVPSPTFVAAAEPVPVSVVSHATLLHANCSRLADGLHNADFQKTDAELAAKVRSDLNGREPYPDLTPIGFRYVGAGPCGNPLPNTIHLLYRTMKPGFRSAISIFVQDNHGQFAMDDSHLYSVASPASPFPMIAWQTPDVVYFLIADNEATEQAALKLLRPASNDSPATTPTR